MLEQGIDSSLSFIIFGEELLWRGIISPGKNMKHALYSLWGLASEQNYNDLRIFARCLAEMRS